MQGEPDVFGKQTIWMPCFLQYFSRFYSQAFNKVPGIQSYIGSLTAQSNIKEKQNEWNDFVESMDALTSPPSKNTEEEEEKRKNYSERWIDTVQMGKATMLLHYTELMINKFDLNENGYIDLQEGHQGLSSFSRNY